MLRWIQRCGLPRSSLRTQFWNEDLTGAPGLVDPLTIDAVVEVVENAHSPGSMAANAGAAAARNNPQNSFLIQSSPAVARRYHGPAARAPRRWTGSACGRS